MTSTLPSIPASEPKLSRGDAIAVLRAYDGEFAALVGLEAWVSSSLSVSTHAATYIRASSSSTETRKILIVLSSTPHALSALESIRDTIKKHTSIPLVGLLKRDDGGSVIRQDLCYSLYEYPRGVPFRSLYDDSLGGGSKSNSYNLEPDSTHSPLSDLPNVSHNLLPETRLRLRLQAELKLGSAFRDLHQNVQNDFFGVPGREKEWEECFSWQEGFTMLVEEVVEDVGRLWGERRGNRGEEGGEGEENAEDENTIQTQTIHRLLSRAIGSFLFDDVEVPSLIFDPHLSPRRWSDRIFVSPTEASTGGEADAGAEVSISGVVGFEESLWGDPLMESVFSTFSPSTSTQENPNSEWPSKAFLEGYASNPITLPRHRTKRLWYDLYGALHALRGVLHADVDGREEERKIVGNIREVVRKLEDAPCY